MKLFNLGQFSFALGLTYGNALLGFAGIIAALHNAIDLAFVLLIGAILCDALDGTIARLQKQTKTQQKMGTVADSIADMISFGVLPAVLFLSISSLTVFSGAVAALYVVTAAHRLVIFTEKALSSSVRVKVFTGLPVVMGAAVIVAIYTFSNNYSWFEGGLTLIMAILALLYISKVPVSKPRGVFAYVAYLCIATVLTIGIAVW